jgi:hypothetical protein
LQGALRILEQVVEIHDALPEADRPTSPLTPAADAARAYLQAMKDAKDPFES